MGIECRRKRDGQTWLVASAVQTALPATLPWLAMRTRRGRESGKATSKPMERPSARTAKQPPPSGNGSRRSVTEIGGESLLMTSRHTHRRAGDSGNGAAADGTNATTTESPRQTAGPSGTWDTARRTHPRRIGRSRRSVSSPLTPDARCHEASAGTRSAFPHGADWP